MRSPFVTESFDTDLEFDDTLELFSEYEEEYFDDDLEFDEEMEWFDSKPEEEVNRRSRSYIRWVQRSLNQILGIRLVVDGIRGPRTRGAIRSFQRWAGIKSDGIVGPQTERALVAAGANSLLSGTRQITRHGDLTANFSLKDFKCRDGTSVPSKYYANVKELARNLQILRDHMKQPIRINSGYRTPSHNKRVGGVPGSQHLVAKAADIHIPGLSPSQVYCTIEALIAAGKMVQGGLGIYRTFVHYDIRGKRSRWKGDGVSWPSCRSTL